MAIEETLGHLQTLPLSVLALLILANALVVAGGLPALLGRGPNLAIGWLARQFLTVFAHSLGVAFGGLAAIETLGYFAHSMALPSWITAATWAVAGTTSWSAQVTLVLVLRDAFPETRRERFLAVTAVLFAFAVAYAVLFL